jgi:hypothetical protein
MIESSPPDIAAWYVNIFQNSVAHQTVEELNFED